MTVTLPASVTTANGGVPSLDTGSNESVEEDKTAEECNGNSSDATGDKSVETRACFHCFVKGCDTSHCTERTDNFHGTKHIFDNKTKTSQLCMVREKGDSKVVDEKLVTNIFLPLQLRSTNT